MKNKLVSVNLTTFNRAHLLPRCLKSIINQSYKNIEIIIVDDCSKDNTADVIKVFQKNILILSILDTIKTKEMLMPEIQLLKKVQVIILHLWMTTMNGLIVTK